MTVIYNLDLKTGLSFYTSEKTLRAAFEGFGELVEGMFAFPCSKMTCFISKLMIM